MGSIVGTTAALCFIGHGAFGIITKAGWVPYFGVVGIPEAWAWKLMPWGVGTMGLTMGILALVLPPRWLWARMSFWANMDGGAASMVR